MCVGRRNHRGLARIEQEGGFSCTIAPGRVTTAVAECSVSQKRRNSRQQKIGGKQECKCMERVKGRYRKLASDETLPLRPAFNAPCSASKRVRVGFGRGRIWQDFREDVAFK